MIVSQWITYSYTFPPAQLEMGPTLEDVFCLLDLNDRFC